VSTHLSILNPAQLPSLFLRRKETLMELTPFEDPVLARMWATVKQMVRTIVDGMSPELLERRTTSAEVEVFALFDPDDRWPVAQIALDLLGTSLADEFGAMRLSPPMEFGSRILLCLRVVVLARAAEEFIPRLRSELEGLFREIVGLDGLRGLSVALAEDSDGP
jgi:hypothetical protein